MNLKIQFKFFILIITITSLNVYSQQDFSSEWITFFEKSNYLETPRYEETIKYFQKLDEYSLYARLISIGVSPQGRNIYCLIVSKDQHFNPSYSKKSRKPIVLINNGIHSGEIEGKDACMLLLRDILVSKEKENLIENVTLYIIPIFNVDGHERMSPYNRINQNGPTEMGWRTTAQNLNLNRDFMKADTPEMKALLNLYSNIIPDMFIDIHTTNGADYQYTITYSISKHKNVPEETRNWMRNKFEPFINNYVEEKGYLISPYVGFKNGDVKNGIVDWIAGPRFSNGYAAVQNRPGLLIETHMLKPYKDRVFSTKALLEAVLEIMNVNSVEIFDINRKADVTVMNEYIMNKQPFPLSLKTTDENKPFIFKGIEEVQDSSWIVGGKLKKYTGEKFELQVPYFDKSTVTDSVIAPTGYLIPAEWYNIVEKMKLHGIYVKTLRESKTFVVEKFRFKNIEFAKRPYEGRFQPKFEYEIFIDTVTVPPGTFYVNTNQRTVGIILHLLEPKGNNSFVKWGFFNQIFEMKEYFSSYSMEPIAQKMIDENPELKKEFLDRVAQDEKFSKSMRQRLYFFYKRSPYFDEKYNLYPIMRVVSKNN